MMKISRFLFLAICGIQTLAVGRSSSDIAAAASAPGTNEIIEIAAPGDLATNISPRVPPAELEKFQVALESARKQRELKDFKRAESSYIEILQGSAPDEIIRPVLLELALVMQEQKQLQKAQHLYAEFIRRYPKDAAVPEVLLRQGYVYREMGVFVLALSKFYSVISSCLNLKLEEVEYYQGLVFQAQVEIAETYYLQGKYPDATDYFSRLLKLDHPRLDRGHVIYKLLRCHFASGNYSEAVAMARLYLKDYERGPDAPETRFLLADSLKKLRQNGEALQEILVLLREQHEKSAADPQQWLYWQQRAGNDIANQLYKEGDYLNALQIYQTLASLNQTPQWQVPVWYQIGLVYENLKQEHKAAEMYDKILAREKELIEQTTLKAVLDMAAWRKQFIDWESKARLVNQQLQPSARPEENL